jgi:hypothetical protein
MYFLSWDIIKEYDETFGLIRCCGFYDRPQLAESVETVSAWWRSDL